MTPERKKLVGAVCLGVAGFLFWMLDVGAYNNLSALRNGITERKQAIEDRQAAIKNRNDLQQNYDRQRSEIQKFTAMIPATKSVPELLSAIDDIARKSGLEVGEIGLNEKAGGKETLAPLTVTLKANGNYDALTNFLDGLERNLRLVDVDAVEVSSDPTSPGVLGITIKANAYFLK